MATSEVPRAEMAPQEESVNIVLNSSKPLHRFVQEKTRLLGIVVLMCGCAELLMAFQGVVSSIYLSFWQGALFLICGILSIHAVMHPSKTIVTASLAMYVVTLLGVIASVWFRIRPVLDSIHALHYYRAGAAKYYIECSIDAVLFLCTFPVFVVLIFLSTLARRALTSTKTQAIVQHIIPAVARDTTSSE